MNHNMRLTLLLGTTLCLAAPSLAEETFPGVEKLMAPEEYRAAGLDKLSPAELKVLNQWLIDYTVEDAEALRVGNEEVRQAEQDVRIEARVEAPFKGWDGETLFRLDNGQVWQQRLSGRFPYHGDDRRVVIEKNFFGFFKMTHVASGRSVGVSRVTR